MAKFESEIQIEVVKRFKDALEKKSTGLTVHTEDRWKTALLIRYFDLVIYKGTNPISVIEVKNTLDNKNILARATDQVRSALSITNSRFGIVTDNIYYYFYDRNDRDKDFVEKSFEEIIKILISPTEIKVNKKDRELVANIIIKAAENNLEKENEILNFLKSKSFLSHVQFDAASNSYYFFDNDGGTNAFENQMFIKMFGEFKEKEICRYTSLDSLFSTLNNISFRMSGLVGMNDKSEVNYVDTYLNGVEKPLIKEHHNTITAINNRYITSCSNISNIDNLTLWRLYSDDSKGVCLVFDTKLNNLDNYVLLQKVKYASKDGKHRELDFLKEIKNEVENQTGFEFEFRKIGYWKHFFKPHEYIIEDEIRLLIIDNDKLPKIKNDWVMTHSHSIFNPIIDFRLNSKEFPIQLKKIILGPKCPEQETNKVQIEELIRRKRKEILEKKIDSNLKILKADLSSIKHYR